MHNQYLQQVIDRGLDMLRSGSVTDEMFSIWLEWSKSVLRMTTNNPRIIHDYMSVVMFAMSSSMKAYDRLSMCMRYLVQMLPFL